MTHRELAVDWSGLPDAVRPLIVAELSPWLWLVPGWCATLTVAWSDDSHGALAETLCEMEYRRGKVTVSPALLSQPRSRRGESLVHELVHVAMWPLSSVADSLAERLTVDGAPLRGLAEEEVRQGCEGACEDLARAIWTRCSVEGDSSPPSTEPGPGRS